MRNLFKSVLKLAAAVVILFVPGFTVLSTLLLAYLGLKVVDTVSDAVQAISDRRKETGIGPDRAKRRRNAAAHRAKVKKNFVSIEPDPVTKENIYQWNLRSFPMDMYPSVGTVSTSLPMKSQFTCGGCENVVTGEFLGVDFWGRDKVRFSMEITDAAKVEQMSKYIAENGILGTTINRKGDSKFELVSDNAVDINDIVKEFYPPKTMEIRRSVNTTRQYIVSGCNSYKEALAKYEKEKFGMSPSAVTVSYQDTVDDHPGHLVKDSNELKADMLGVGEYIINVTDTEVFSRRVSVAAGLNETDEAMRSRAVDAVIAEPFKRESDLVEDACSASSVISDGLEGKNPSRYIEYGESKVPVLDDLDSSVESLGANLYIKYDNVDDFLNAVSGGVELKGGMVLVDTVPPDVGDDKFLISVPVTREVLSLLEVNRDKIEAAVKKYDFSDLSAEEIRSSCLVNELAVNKYLSARLSADPDLSDAKVNGVHVRDFVERMGEMTEKGVSDELKNHEQYVQWLADSKKILSVSMDVDMRTNELILSTTIQNGDKAPIETKSETRKLNEAEMKAMSERGLVSKTELKDLVMKMYPKNFGVYSKKDSYGVFQSIYEEPLEAFIRGEKPRLKSFPEKKVIKFEPDPPRPRGGARIKR